MGSSTHGKLTVITCNAATLTGCNKSTLTRNRDVHDDTEYGDDDYGSAPGLRKPAFTAAGWYDTTANTGNRAILEPLYESGQIVTWTRKPEGTGTGKPLETFSGFVSQYAEDSPVKDLVQWTLTVAIDGPVTVTTQP